MGEAPPAKGPSFSFLSAYNSYLKRLYQFYGLKSEQVQIDEYTSMHCWAPKKKGKTGLSPLLILHGFGASALMQWDKQLGPLSKHFQLFIPDLVFFGDSTTTSPDRSEEFQAESCYKLMQHYGISNFHLLGYSYGGAVSYQLALSHPDTVLKIVLLATGILATPRDIEVMGERLGVEYVSAMLPKDIEGVKRLLKLAYYRPPWVPNFILKEVLKTMFVNSRRKEHAELQTGLRYRKEHFEPSEVPAITQDVLIIQGEFDPLFPPDLGQRLQSHLGHRAQLAVIAKTAHMPQAERPTFVNRAIVDFLAS